MKANNYDSIAGVYDRLSNIVFGKAIVNSQLFALPLIERDNKILIAGGGTGWILEEIAKIHSCGLEITYIDASAKMISQAKKRNAGKNTVSFIQESISLVSLKKDYYDVIITSFFFDNFYQLSCKQIFEQLHPSLQIGGKWLLTDFQLKKKNKFWHKPLVKSMYMFFKLTCGIQASHLPDVNPYFFRHNYRLTAAKYFFSNLILSSAFEKKLKI